MQTYVELMFLLAAIILQKHQEFVLALFCYAGLHFLQSHVSISLSVKP